MSAAGDNACTLLSADDFSPRSRECDVSRDGNSCACGDSIAGKYQLDSILGEGAVGQIWNARDQVAGHSVAVKVVSRGDREPEEALIFLARCPDGWIQPKLVDFGLAKMDWEPSHASDGTLVGSPAYMSPEQGQSLDAVDCRTDLWGFAVVLYETIAGKTPWDASNWPALLHAIVSDPAPSLVGSHGVEAVLWGILQRGLEKDPDARWQTSHEFAVALADWLASQDTALDLIESSTRRGPAEDDEVRAPRSSCIRRVRPQTADKEDWLGRGDS